MGGEILTPSQFNQQFYNVVHNPDDFKILANGRFAYWKGNTFVVINPNASGDSSMFIPRDGKAYFNRQ